MQRKKRKNRLSMTSLIDVIFLLLLFFMLSSTFSKFSEVPLPVGTAGTVASQTTPMFLRVTSDEISLNGETIALDGLPAALAGEPDAPTAAIVGLGPEVTAQRLTDVLAVVKMIPHLTLNVLVPA
ncbi:ExbD/TolR family protein [Yoonia maritima]|uniref:ExbD/TolR family protein n=1 Tax=Yoonia maritima TaxID=1435347 RepID=UPI000D10D08C|nr:biopolymer transporter ExbD [Yoonia maritima]